MEKEKPPEVTDERRTEAATKASSGGHSQSKEHQRTTERSSPQPKSSQNNLRLKKKPTGLAERKQRSESSKPERRRPTEPHAVAGATSSMTPQQLRRPDLANLPSRAPRMMKNEGPMTREEADKSHSIPSKDRRAGRTNRRNAQPI